MPASGAKGQQALRLVGVGVLVVLVLQTDLELERTAAGKWRFKIHKKALSDSVLGKLIATYTGGGGQ
ncbi:hypothetical protein [Streptomyces sp. NPDC058755]|uniref:hypothetical protein n=1 Tax=Streptomyces sp. NPDC058755 TaxID=3346624 RepID=UPI00368CD42D